VLLEQASPVKNYKIPAFFVKYETLRQGGAELCQIQAEFGLPTEAVLISTTKSILI
jgi:hypothetical protein